MIKCNYNILIILKIVHFNRKKLHITWCNSLDLDCQYEVNTKFSNNLPHEREGEIVTLGIPIYENDQLAGFVVIDTAIITRGVTSSTSLDLPEFEGNFKAGFTPYDLTAI